MAITIVVTILTKILSTVLKELVHKTVSVAPTIDVFQQHGIVMVMTIVATMPMNHQNTAKVKVVPASVTSSPVTTATVYQEFISVMVIMIVWIILMRIIDISVMIASVMKRMNLLVQLIKLGEEHSAYQRSGFVMAILIALMALMRIVLYINVHHLNLVVMINLLVETAAASTR